MKLGTMLLRDGRITQAQLDQAIAEQGRRGGRLGTVLFELGMLDADALTVYLGLELGIPIATRAVLDRAKRAAVRLLSPELAERFVCVPLLVQDRALVAAIKDPLDLLALDELSMQTGMRLIPRVAPELRLHYYVERYFGVPRPKRYADLGERVVEVRRPSADSVEPPPPPLPGLPPPSRKPAQPPAAPAPALRPVPASTAPPPDEDELAIEMEAEPGEVAQVAAAAPPSRPQRPSKPPPSLVGSAPLTFEDATAHMTQVSSRSEVADVLLGFARTLFDVGVVCMVRDDLAFGWKGFGPDLDDDRVETLLLPLDTPSIFRIAIETDDLFVGPTPPSAIHGHLFKILRTSAPAQAVVAPVLIRDRVVNLVYGHRSGDKELPEAELEHLRRLADDAAQAYARLITQHKK